jgi:hypothetical protein
MGFREDALKILHDTELSLRELIERALSVQQYSEVADVARFADAVAHLRRDGIAAPSPTQSSIPSAGEEASDKATSSAPSTKSSRGRRAKGSGFPRFERDGEKLVKIGWSKRDERVYEHRAPREVVFLVGVALSTKVKPKTVFTMEQVLPVNDAEGNEVPSYQAYLGLAWLRSIGLIQKRGKEGYVLANGALDNAKLQRLWNSVPERH